MEKRNVPKLRFKGFECEWKEYKLGTIGEFFKGNGISKSDLTIEGQECILYGELYTTYNEVISKVKSRTNIDLKNSIKSKINDLIIPSSGEIALDIATASCVMKSGVLLGGDLNVFRAKNDNGIFLSYQLNNSKKKEIAKIAQGASVVHIYNEQLKKIKVNIPSLEEQNKIANFLSNVDNIIEEQEGKVKDLEQYKKGMIQKIFKQEVRFKDENGGEYPEWKEKKLGDVSIIRRGASPRPIADSRWFKENSTIGWVRISDVTKSNKYLENVTQYLSEEGVKRSRLLKTPHLILSIAASVGKPIINKIPVCIHDGFIVFENLKLDINFGYYFLVKCQNEWEKFKQPGTQFNLNSDLVSSMRISIPCLEEQIKIANFLSNIDNIIEEENKKLEDLRLWKKGLLQQMFV